MNEWATVQRLLSEISGIIELCSYKICGGNIADTTVIKHSLEVNRAALKIGTAAKAS